MAIRWDWLQPVVTAPYLPTLGPVHPEAVTAGLITDVIENAETGRFLSHDKDRRWSDHKDEQVIASAIAQEPGLVMIPTLSARHVPNVKVHLYSRNPRAALARAAGLGRRLCGEHGAGKGRVLVLAARQRHRSRCGPYPCPDAHLRPRATGRPRHARRDAA